jgi:catechol 2,3-dioxygenase-like lactoylglutathione lyase family enzyme
MSTPELSNSATGEAAAGPAIAQRFEVANLPVSDVDRAKAFYQRIGWRLDIDFEPAPNTRVVQFTPPGSQASIQFGHGRTTMTEPHQGLLLIVDDIEAAREDLVRRGADVSPVFHNEPGKGQVPGRDPQRRSYQSFATFADPDGNTWLVQEITERLPGRVDTDVPGTAELLHETSERHGRFEAVAPPHDWWDWYAAYMEARRTGAAPDDASASADRYMAEVKHVVVG